MVCDTGQGNRVKKNSRVVAFIKEELSYEVVKKNMEGDLMPEIWLRLGHREKGECYLDLCIGSINPGTQMMHL